MRRFVLFLLLLAALAAPAAAQTPEERERLDWVLERGRLLFEIDRAAWVTTDDFREHLSEADQRLIRGWTVERDGAGYVVVYYMLGEEDVRLALYRGRVENRRVVSREIFRPNAGPELTPMQRRIAEARNLVARMDARVCAERPNIAVIPPDGLDGPMDVYVLTSQTQVGIYPFGGHSRATFSAAGELLSQRAFTNSCLNMPTPPSEARVEALAVTHLLDRTPTEIHVFLSIWTGMPIWVGTAEPERIWQVRPERIELIDPERLPRS